MTTSRTDLQAEVFGSLFVLMQNLTRRVDEGLEPFGLRSRQWLLLAVLARAFPGHAPTLSEAATVYGSSRQNVKQLALQLAARGYLTLEDDPDDARAVRLRLSDTVAALDEPAARAEQAALLDDVFAGLTPDEVRLLLRLVVRCLDHLSDGATTALAHPTPERPKGGER